MTIRFARTLRRAAALAALVAVLRWSLPVAVAAGDQPPSNLDLIKSLCTIAAEDLADRFLSRVGEGGVELKPTSNDERYRVLGNVFSAVLKSRDAKVYVPGADAAPSPLRLEFEAVEFELDYAKGYRSHLIGGKRIERRSKVRVAARLIRANDGEVIWIGESDAERTDQFDVSDQARIEEGTYSFLKPEAPSAGWGKLVEPVFVSGIVVGLVYLFFSNQSDN